MSFISRGNIGRRLHALRSGRRLKKMGQRHRLAIENLEARRLLAVFIVDTFVDSASGTCGVSGIGNSDCSLRSAIIAANAAPGADTINLPVGTHTLSLQNSLPVPDQARGDLNITDSLTIISTNVDLDPTTTIVDAAQIDRVFSIDVAVTPITVVFNGITIRNGLAPRGLPGGGIDADINTSLELRNVIVENNRVDSSVQFGGDADGGGIATSGNLLLDNVSVNNNFAEAFGGGIAMFDDGTLSIRDSNISNNTAGLDGGGIWAGNVANYQINFFQMVSIDRNQAGPRSRGGGIYVVGNGTDTSSVNLSLVDFVDNTSGDAGGGAYVQNVGSFNQDDGQYENNRSSDGDGFGGGGGLYLLNNGSSTISGTTFRNNVSVSGGGGAAILTDATLRNTVFDNNRTTSNGAPGTLRFDDGGGAIAIAASSGIVGPTVRIENSRILNNTSPLAGGIGAANSNVDIVNTTIQGNTATDTFPGAGGIGFAQDGTNGIAANRVRLTVTDSAILGNTSLSDAGGIGVADADASITNSTISGNTASGRGAGIGIIGINNSPNLRLDRATVDTNTAGTDGGGIAVQDASFFTTNTTISKNAALNNGGGILFLSAAPLLTGSVEFSTIASNRAGVVGSNVAVNGSVTRFLSSIVADPLGNTPVINMVSGGPGELSSQGFNLFSNSNFSNPSPSDLLGVDPLLGDLADNGGPVRTRALLNGSPAIDAGANAPLAVDARGFPRPIDGDGDSVESNDIGAFEADSISVFVIADDSTLPVIEDTDTPLDLLPLVNVTGSATVPTFTIETQPARGVVSVIGTTITFVPAQNDFTNVNSPLSFVYTASVGSASDTGTVTINISPVNDPPIFITDPVVTANQSVPLTIVGSTILRNDLPGPPNESGTVSIASVNATSAQRGSVSLNGQNIVYTSVAGFTGSDTITYSISDGASPPLLAAATLTVNVIAGNPTALIHTLSTGSGDGGLTLQVDSFGVFGSGALPVFSGAIADYDPVGPLNSAPAVFESFVAFRTSAIGPRLAIGDPQFTPSQSPDVTLENAVSGSLSEASSRFRIGQLIVDLVQRVESTIDVDGARIGSRLVQSYFISNPTATQATLDLVRFNHADLLFDGSARDGGGVLFNSSGDPTLFVTDPGSIGSTDATFVGTITEGGVTQSANRFRIDGFIELANLVLDGDVLDGAVVGDTSGDGFIDTGNEYDVALALRNLLTIDPGQSVDYVTTTMFGSRPDSVVTPAMSEISGVISCDLNGNGVVDSNEASPFVTVFVDLDGDRLLDLNEDQTQTDSSGNYRISVATSSLPQSVNVVVQNPPSCRAVAPEIGVTRSAITTGALSRSITAADIDSDGDNDLLVVNELGNDVSVLINGGSAGFSAGSPIQVGKRPVAIATWQPSFSASPVFAVAAVGTTANQGSLYVIENGIVSQELSAGNGPVAVAIDDFNGDQQADFVVATLRSGTIVARMSGETTERVLATARSPKSVMTADVNGDSFTDLVVVSYGYDGDTASEVTLLLGDGRGNFTSQVQSIPGRGAVDVTTGNFDSDQAHEVVVASYSGLVRIFDFASGVLTESRRMTTEPGIEAIAARDLNGDGRVDLVIANAKAETIELFINNPNEPTGFVRNRTITGVSSPSDLVIADLDGDSILDVAVSNLYGAGRSGFTLPSSATILGLTVTEREVTITANPIVENFGFAFVPPTSNAGGEGERQFDVDRSGDVTPRDALIVINQMSRNRNGEGEAASQKTYFQPDVNRDGQVTPLDALLVMNHMSRQRRAKSAEGELLAASVDTEIEKRQHAVDALMEDVGSLF